MVLVLSIDGKPNPRCQHRINNGVIYDPDTLKKQNFASIAIARLGYGHIFDEPIYVDFTYHLQVPASMSKKRREELVGTPHHLKPILSSLVRFTEDSLQGVLWRNDAKICQIRARKVWSTFGKTIIKVYTEKEYDEFKMS